MTAEQWDRFVATARERILERLELELAGPPPQPYLWPHERRDALEHCSTIVAAP